MNDQLQSKRAMTTAEGPVSLTFLSGIARFNLRTTSADLQVASEAFGVTLPTTIGNVAGNGTRHALCVGPDEWVLYADEAESESIQITFQARYASAPHSLVDISDREITLSITGAQASTLLSVGCPINLADIAIGCGTRTVFDGVSVVIHRDSEEKFRLEVWRSFLPYVWELLNTANQELATGF